MPIHTNVLPKVAEGLTVDCKGGGFCPWPYIDTLYDYISFLNPKSSGEDDPIATLPEEKWGTPVAIIGAGAGGHEVVREDGAVWTQRHDHKIVSPVGGLFQDEQLRPVQ